MINNIDIDKIAVSNKVSFGKNGFKCYIGYKDAKKIMPLSIFLPKMSVCRRDFEETKYMYFLIKDDELLEKYNKFGKKLELILNKNLIVNLYTMKNIQKLKSNLIREISKQILIIIKY